MRCISDLFYIFGKIISVILYNQVLSSSDCLFIDTLAYNSILHEVLIFIFRIRDLSVSALYINFSRTRPSRSTHSSNRLIQESDLIGGKHSLRSLQHMHSVALLIATR